ncbi:MAG: alcohol dehydrogenase catalytic domain-containing protein [Caldilineaceae bacterium]
MPEPGHGQVLVKMKASSICGSDIRAIYREHLGHGPEAYQGVIGGHEPCGQIVAVGPGCKRFQVGDQGHPLPHQWLRRLQRLPRRLHDLVHVQRAAYGWQRDGGHADYCLAEESTCVALPEPLTYVDGAQACGFGTVYEALNRHARLGRGSGAHRGHGAGGHGGRSSWPKKMGAHPRSSAWIFPRSVSISSETGTIDQAIVAGDEAVARSRR